VPEAITSASRFGDHARSPLLREDDRHSVERDEAAQLANERSECLVEIERRAEGTRAAIRGVEQICPTAELVAQSLGFGGTLLRHPPLLVEPSDEPADDQREQKAGHGLEDDELDPVVDMEVVGAPQLEPRSHGHRRGRGRDSADHPESRRTGDDRQEEELPARRARLEGVEERERRDDPEVEDERDELERSRGPVADHGEERDGTHGEDAGEDPGEMLRLRRRKIAQRDQQHGERDREEANDSDPPLERAVARAGHVRSCTRASAQDACSASSSSPSAA
jgi:hypothetical protein